MFVHIVAEMGAVGYIIVFGPIVIAGVWFIKTALKKKK